MTRALITLALLLPVGALAAPKKAEIKGQVRFDSTAPMEKIVGTGQGEGTLTVDFDDLKATRGVVKVPVTSMKTGNDQRDEHLHGADWLDAEKHPDIVFTIESVEVVKQEDKGKYKQAELKAKGKFSLHGVTTDLTAPVVVKWKDDKLKAQTDFQVKLADYQVTGKDGVIGEKVGETIDITGSFKGVAR